MDLGLSDKRALVLAGTRGLGRGIANALAAEGASVALSGRNSETAEAVAREIAERHGVAAHGFAADLADPAAVAAMCDGVAGALGGIDCLLLNSGGPPPGPLAETETETWIAQFRAMVLSLFDVANAFLPGMRERGWGRILLSASSGSPISGSPTCCAPGSAHGSRRCRTKLAATASRSTRSNPAGSTPNGSTTSTD